MDQDYRARCRDAWAYLARHGCESSRPWGEQQFSAPRRWLDGRGWIPWRSIQRVLCLACGGGQQAPLFAALGYNVTLVDLSPEQLRLDAAMARRYGLQIECLEGDMLDLGGLEGREFDLVYQAVSACYVPSVTRLYSEVARVLRSGGWYRVEHWNPAQIQLDDQRPWDGLAYRISHPQVGGPPKTWRLADNQSGLPSASCWHFIHPLDELIGGLCEAGFNILRFAETRPGDLGAPAGSDAHLAAYLPPFFAMLARRREQPTSAANP